LWTACTTTSSNDCDDTKANALLDDVLYLMGRSSDVREKRVFYKIQSVGVRSMAPLVEQQRRHVPWIFLYRNSVEVMMSHFKDATIRNKAVCLRGRDRPHPLITEIANTHNRTLKSLSNAEYCAIHLVSGEDYIHCCD
jgi:desulfoferrodoxin (superoxide reductase-like protein)